MLKAKIDFSISDKKVEGYKVDISDFTAITAGFTKEGKEVAFCYTNNPVIVGIHLVWRREITDKRDVRTYYSQWTLKEGKYERNYNITIVGSVDKAKEKAQRLSDSWKERVVTQRMKNSTRT